MSLGFASAKCMLLVSSKTLSTNHAPQSQDIYSSLLHLLANKNVYLANLPPKLDLKISHFVLELASQMLFQNKSILFHQNP